MRLLALFILAFLALPLRGDVPTMRSVREIYARTKHADATNWCFDCTGQIMLATDRTPRCLNLIDRDFPYTLNFFDFSDEAQGCQAGDLVRVKGFVRLGNPPFTRRNSARTTVCITNMTRLGAVPLPPTTAATAHEINTFATSNRFVHVDGVVSAVMRDDTNEAWNWIILQTPDGPVRAAVTDADAAYAKLLPLIDAEVRLRGLAHESSAWRKFLDHNLILFGRGGIEVLRPSPDPFAAPPLNERPAPHRQQTSGRVVGVGRGRFFLADDLNRFVQVIASTSDPACPGLGARVTVSGFAARGPLGYVLTEAVVRTDAPPVAAPEERIRDVTPAQLFLTDGGDAVVDAALYGKLVRLRGRVANRAENIRAEGRILLDCGNRTLTADVAHLPETGLDEDCQISVAGLCLADFEADVTNLVFPRFKGLVLVPRQPSDIVVLARPPWWTPRRLTVVAALLVCAFLGFIVCREQITAAKTRLKIKERTRLAVELHDSISQTLTGVAHLIDAAQHTEHRDAAAAERFLESARVLLASCRKELRCCIWDLKSRTFEAKDIAEAIEQILAPHLGPARLHVRFHVPRAILTDTVMYDTLRILRELATNAIRHGSARNIRIAGECRDGRIRFSVQDDGRAFDPKSAPGPAQGHFGLQGIRERIRNRNGAIQFENTANGGNKITVSFACENNDRNGK